MSLFLTHNRICNMTMKSQYSLILLALCLAVVGCKHRYVASEYPITPDRISATKIEGGKDGVRIVAGKASDTKIDLGNVGVHHYYGTHQQLTDAIVKQLASELRSRGVENVSSANKKVEVAVTDSNFESGMWRIAANLKFTVKLGDAKPMELGVRNGSPGTVARSYNGAVALAVIEILNNQDVLNYLQN